MQTSMSLIHRGLRVTSGRSVNPITQESFTERASSVTGGAFFLTANGVVIFEYNTQRNGLSGVVNIFMRGDNGISRFIMRIFSGILTRRIDNRFTNNLKDMKKIIRDIAHNPHKVRDTLAGRLLNDFNSVFPVMETKPAED